MLYSYDVPVPPFAYDKLLAKHWRYVKPGS